MEQRRCRNCSFYFWTAGSALEKSQEGLLRNLLHQILQRHPSLIDRCLSMLLKLIRERSNFRPEWMRKDLHKALIAALRDDTITSRYCFFVDGLDELEEDHEDLLGILQSLENLNTVKLCVASREWTVLESHYGDRQTGFHMRLQSVNQADIEMYILARLKEHDRFSYLWRGEEDAARELLQTIRDRSQGVFLWVCLVTNNLRRGLGKNDTVSVLRARLRAMPVELEDYFQNIFDHIEPFYRKVAARTLHVLHERTAGGLHPAWIPCIEQDTEDSSYAIRAPMQFLSVTQIRELLTSSATSVRRWGQDLLDVSIPDEASFSCNEVRESLLGLVPHSDCWIQFGHRSMHDFIASKIVDKTLEEFTGQCFDPFMTMARIMVRSSRMVHGDRKTLFHLVLNFTELVDHRRSYSPVERTEWAELFRELVQTTKLHLAENGTNFQWGLMLCVQPYSWPVLSHSDFEAIALPAIALYFRCKLLYDVSLDLISDCSQISTDVWCTLLESTMYRHVWDSADFIGYKVFVGETSDDALGIVEHIPDFNKPIHRVHGGKKYVWQRYISGVNARLQEEKAYQIEFDRDEILRNVQTMLDHGADPDAFVDAYDDDFEPTRSCPAKLAFDAANFSTCRQRRFMQPTKRGAGLRVSREVTDNAARSVHY